MDSAELKSRTKDFAHRCVKLSLALPQNDLGVHIRRQLMRCSTSVAANYRAVCLAHSKVSFAAKLSIVLEEADECEFWLDFAITEKLITMKKASLLLKESQGTYGDISGG